MMSSDKKFFLGMAAMAVLIYGGILLFLWARAEIIFHDRRCIFVHCVITQEKEDPLKNFSIELYKRSK